MRGRSLHSGVPCGQWSFFSFFNTNSPKWKCAINGQLWRLCRTSPGPLKSLELSTHTVHKLNTRMGIPTSSWACTTNSWAAPAQRTGADLPATLVCWQLGILHQQLGLLGRLPAGLALERPVWSCHGLDTWLLLRLRSCTRTALAQGWTDGRAGRAGRTRQQRRVLDCPRADFRVKSLPMGRYPLISRSRTCDGGRRRRAVSGRNGVKASPLQTTWVLIR